MGDLMGYLFTSESVSEGHPDKLCDKISDSILDACISVDSNARVAVETMVKGTDSGSHIFIGGEVTIASGSLIDYEAIARETASEIGYSDHSVGMDSTDEDGCETIVRITQQSPDISQGVDEGKGLHIQQGAGDQGLMFGYASNETEPFDELRGSFMPLPAALSQRLTTGMTQAMKDGTLPWARPDSKSQVTVEYDDDGNPLRVHTVVVAVQHDDALKDRFDGDIEAEQSYIREIIKKEVVEHAIPDYWLKEGYILHVNGTGRFADPGGPYADAGITGRKIVVDTYGGMARHGGGAFSGKDPTKVDRSATYYTRWAAKHVVAAGLATRCEIQVAYVIGVASPVSLRVETFGSGTISEEELTERVSRVFDFRPAAISRDLKLQRPLYSATSAGGHFGRPPTDEGHFEWERLDQSRLEALKS